MRYQILELLRHHIHDGVQPFQIGILDVLQHHVLVVILNGDARFLQLLQKIFAVARRIYIRHLIAALHQRIFRR